MLPRDQTFDTLQVECVGCTGANCGRKCDYELVVNVVIQAAMTNVPTADCSRKQKKTYKELKYTGGRQKTRDRAWTPLENRFAVSVRSFDLCLPSNSACPCQGPRPPDLDFKLAPKATDY